MIRLDHHRFSRIALRADFLCSVEADEKELFSPKISAILDKPVNHQLRVPHARFSIVSSSFLVLLGWPHFVDVSRTISFLGKTFLFHLLLPSLKSLNWHQEFAQKICNEAYQLRFSVVPRKLPGTIIFVKQVLSQTSVICSYWRNNSNSLEFLNVCVKITILCDNGSQTVNSLQILKFSVWDWKSAFELGIVLLQQT